jgi:hypothetical protein
MRLSGTAIVVFAVLIGLSHTAAAQTRRNAAPARQTRTTYGSDVSNADVQRLQDNIYDASREVSQVRNRDAALASQLQAELDEAREDAIYLKVKLRRNEPIAHSDYSDVRDKIENIRSRARGDATGGYTTPRGDSTGVYTPSTGANDRDQPRPAGTVGRTSGQNQNEVPAGTEFDVRLQNSLSSATAQVEDRFQATTLVDLMQGDRVLVPAGSVMRGVVSTVTKAGHIERKGALTIAFDQITIRNRSYPIHATVEQALESEGIRGEATKIGGAAGVGAIIGAIIGGVKGALAGVLIGGGGVIAATEGKDVELPPGTVLRVRLDSALIVR